MHIREIREHLIIGRSFIDIHDGLVDGLPYSCDITCDLSLGIDSSFIFLVRIDRSSCFLIVFLESGSHRVPDSLEHRSNTGITALEGSSDLFWGRFLITLDLGTTQIFHHDILSILRESLARELAREQFSLEFISLSKRPIGSTEHIDRFFPSYERVRERLSIQIDFLEKFCYNRLETVFVLTATGRIWTIVGSDSTVECIGS